MTKINSAPIDNIATIFKPSITKIIAPWAVTLIGLVGMYFPTFRDLFNGLWAGDQQGHGPIVLAVSIWLLGKKAPQVIETPLRPAFVIGWSLLIFGSLLYIIGRSQNILIFEVGSLIVMTASITLILRGMEALKHLWFPLVFMVFMIPLPGVFVDAMTQPMKTAVSYAVESALYAVGYPISRSGVILQIGQYQLLVADACAGLNTLFTLEALGLLYLNLVKHESVARNIILAICIVPISFAANIIRVIALTLITYHLGDEAGQGFLHGFAGMVLFMAALLLIILFDGFLRIILARKS
ncbi:exosortase B [Sphaerotilus sulfidivorans]|jgi:exosortase B|uniref:Exosortase B n=1 Tax=Sphaerotilus sulfidivorans TaxID=639200 RepID=A0A5C1Q5V3_9BURK|nr:exosortase B [Sphaerotilus sulfidivorans]NZD47531.1 exosortase B [Sphaerotilus sulfidivorans]QEN02837.1 exosortase B [Sphaerotilus sulfidivorans]